MTNNTRRRNSFATFCRFAVNAFHKTNKFPLTTFLSCDLLFSNDKSWLIRWRIQLCYRSFCLVRTPCLIIDIETISKDLKVSQIINRLLVLLWFMNNTLMCLLWNLTNQSLFSSLASKLQALEIEVFLLSYFKKRNRERLKSSTIFKASRQDIILSFWSLA